MQPEVQRSSLHLRHFNYSAPGQDHKPEHRLFFLPQHMCDKSHLKPLPQQENLIAGVFSASLLRDHWPLPVDMRACDLPPAVLFMSLGASFSTSLYCSTWPSSPCSSSLHQSLCHMEVSAAVAYHAQCLHDSHAAV